ncbi:MAG: alpha-E domain-containing protein, partial [Betaproteobacteria bacterium]
PLVITDTLAAFQATGRPMRSDQVAQFLAWDPDHPSSIFNCIQSCRENARSVRGAMTVEMWECINDTWLELLARKKKIKGPDHPVDSSLFEWIKQRSHLFRGVTFATIQRDQPYHFIRLGTYLERADNTARILSVKTQVEQAESNDLVDDYYRLGAVLRSVSALEAYRDTYRDAIDADRVSELLIFNSRVPRSLHFCLDETAYILNQLPQQTGREARKRCANLLTNLKFGSLSEVYDSGLENYLELFVKENIALAEAVQTDYLESIA